MRTLSLAFLLGLTLTFAACGSDDDTTPATTTTDAGSTTDGASGSDATTGADTGTATDAGTSTDSGTTADTGTAAPVSLTKDVLPILANHCGFCHNPKGKGPSVANKVYYATKADILGLKGKAYTPGDSAKSGLIGIMKQSFGLGANKTLMPPPKSGRPKVSDAEIALVAKWIDEGALDN